MVEKNGGFRKSPQVEWLNTRDDLRDNHFRIQFHVLKPAIYIYSLFPSFHLLKQSSSQDELRPGTKIVHFAP